MFTQEGCPPGVPLPRLPYWLFFARWPDLILQDHGVDTVTALHATKGLDAVFTGAAQAVVPLAHEQARATSAGFGRELLVHGKGSNHAPGIRLLHSFATLRLFWHHNRFHDSVSRLLVRRDRHVTSERHAVLSR